ncbi:hypothetical protein VNI00_011303 [Paramarasmius palmivorus]|uniref:Uncharacterized protein n=1 Tax=Paramarasmius palmivorus TaxID=297713 RepID=A0AAW0CH32_9AGAR
MAERKLRNSTLGVQPGKYAPDPPSDGLLSSQATSSPVHTGDNATYIDEASSTPVKNYDPKKRTSLSETHKDRVVQSSRYGKRCGFCRESFMGNRDHEFFHAMEKCTPIEFVHHVEPQWGRAHGTLNIFESRWNIGVATASLHKAFDSSAFLLLPEKSILERVLAYAKSPLERRKPFDEVFKLFQDQYWVYTFFPLKWNKKRSIFIRNLNETGDPVNSEEDEPEMPGYEDKYPNAPGYTEFRPWKKDDEGVLRYVPLEFEFHIHPFYLIYNAGQKLAVLLPDEAVEVLPRDERLDLIVSIWNIWVTAYEGPSLRPRQPTDDGEPMIPNIEAREETQKQTDSTSTEQEDGKQPLLPAVAEDEDKYRDSDDELDEEDIIVSRQETSRIAGDEQSTAVPPPSTIAGPSTAVDEGQPFRKSGRAKSTVSAPIWDRMDRVRLLEASTGEQRQAAMTDVGYTRDSSPASVPRSSPTPQNTRWSPFPLPTLPAKRKYENKDETSEPRQGTSTSMQPPPVPPKLPRARTTVSHGANVRLGQNQDPQDTQTSSAQGTLDVQAQALRRSSRHQRGSIAGRSTGSGSTTLSSTRARAGLVARSAASAGSSRARLGGGSLPVPVEDLSDDSGDGDGDGEYLPKRRKQQ